jgi:hypothetical protein
MGYTNPVEDMMQEAEGVGTLLQNLAAMGITCPELIQASIESETNFVEVIEAQLKAAGEVQAMVDGIDQYTKTLGERKDRFKRMVDQIREGIAEAMNRADKKSLVTAFGTVSTGKAAARLNVTAEAKVPEHYFGMALNSAELKKDLVAWQKGLDALDKIKDEEERTKARAEYLKKHPPIPGAELIEGKATLTIRRK